MEFLISFLISLGAGIVCHFICKWLEGNSDNE